MDLKRKNKLSRFAPMKCKLASNVLWIPLVWRQSTNYGIRVSDESWWQTLRSEDTKHWQTRAQPANINAGLRPVICMPQTFIQTNKGILKGILTSLCWIYNMVHILYFYIYISVNGHWSTFNFTEGLGLRDSWKQTSWHKMTVWQMTTQWVMPVGDVRVDRGAREGHVAHLHASCLAAYLYIS